MTNNSNNNSMKMRVPGAKQAIEKMSDKNGQDIENMEF